MQSDAASQGRRLVAAAVARLTTTTQADLRQKNFAVLLKLGDFLATVGIPRVSEVLVR